METCLTREKINVAGSLTEVKVKIGKWDVAYNYIEGELKHKITTDSSAPEILLPTAFLVFQDGQNKKNAHTATFNSQDGNGNIYLATYDANTPWNKFLLLLA